jgi:hypothetical protein
VAKVESWSKTRFYPELVGKPASLVGSMHPTARLTGEVQGNAHNVFMLLLPRGSASGDYVITDSARAVSVTFGKAFTESYGDVQGIYDMYAKEITPFVKREFGAKEVVEALPGTHDIALRREDGRIIPPNTVSWLEWDVLPLFANLPIRYYALTNAVADATDQIAERTGVEDLPKTFTRFQGVLQTVLQLNQMAKMLPGVKGLQDYRDNMRRMHALKAQMFAGPNDRIHQWHKIGREQAKKVEEALRDQQLGGVHWTALVQQDITLDDGTTKKVWVHVPTASFQGLMQSRGITAEGQELFLGIVNDFLSTLQMMEDVVRTNLTEFFADNPTALAGRLALSREEFEKLRQTPYLPDMRFGKWSVQIKAGRAEDVEGRQIRRGELVYWEKFATKRDRDRRFAELKKQYGTQHNVSASFDDDVSAPLRGLPQSLVEVMTEVLNSHEDTKLTEAQAAAIADMAFDQTAAGKFAKYLGTPKKNIGGASKDIRRAYAAYHWKTANAVAKLYYFRSLTRAMGEIKGDAMAERNQGGTSDAFDKLYGYTRRNFSYVMQPQHEFEQLRSFVSLWYLWGSAKTAVMNLMSVPVLSFPYLWSRYGMLQSQAALLRAMKDVAQYWRDPTKLSLDKQRVLAKFKADGVTDQSFAAMLASVADGGVAFERLVPHWEFAGSDATRRMVWKVTSLGMMPFRAVEQLNRQVTGLAAYDLESQRLGETLSTGGTAAYQFAHDAVDYTQNEYGPWNRPPIMQGKQSILLLFFSFVQNMSFMMFGGDKSWWRAMMVLAALAGLQGLPGMDNLIDIMNWALRRMTGQYVDLRAEAREVAENIGLNPDIVMHGVSHSWGIGWDTSNSIGQGRVIPGTDAIFGIGKFEDRFLNAAGDIGGPVGSLAISFLQAIASDNPNMLLAFDKMLPPVIRNIERMYNAATLEEFQSGSGRTLVKDPTVTELAGQALGFAPTRKTQQQELLHMERDAVQYYIARRANLMETMYVARKTHDYDAIAEARAKINEYNNGVPHPTLRITGDEIAKSVEARKRTEAETSQNRAPAARYQALYQQIGSTF